MYNYFIVYMHDSAIFTNCKIRTEHKLDTWDNITQATKAISEDIKKNKAGKGENVVILNIMRLKDDDVYEGDDNERLQWERGWWNYCKEQ